MPCKQMPQREPTLRERRSAPYTMSKADLDGGPEATGVYRREQKASVPRAGVARWPRGSPNL